MKPDKLSITLGPYQLLEQLAQGAYGEVYRARHIGPAGFQRILAIKRLKRHVMEDPSAVRAFENEARIGGLLLHHNIAQTIEFGQDSGHYYLAMEYIDGISFLDMVSRHRTLSAPIHVPTALELIAQACEGLHYAHEAKGPDGTPLKLVHRDIKPSNLMLTRNGVVKVMDFGIARVDNQNLTDAGFIKGTPRYLSPEVIARNAAIDRRSDLFSLGTVLYELLALKPLFDAPNLLMLMARVREADVGAQLRELSRQHPAVARVLSRALNVSPAERFQTGREMARELRQLRRELGGDEVDLEAFAAAELSGSTSAPPAPPAPQVAAGPTGAQPGSGPGRGQPGQGQAGARGPAAASGHVPQAQPAPAVLPPQSVPPTTRMQSPFKGAAQQVVPQDPAATRPSAAQQAQTAPQPVASTVRTMRPQPPPSEPQQTEPPQAAPQPTGSRRANRADRPLIMPELHLRSDSVPVDQLAAGIVPKFSQGYASEVAPEPVPSASPGGSTAGPTAPPPPSSAPREPEGPSHKGAAASGEHAEGDIDPAGEIDPALASLLPEGGSTFRIPTPPPIPASQVTSLFGARTLPDAPAPPAPAQRVSLEREPLSPSRTSLERDAADRPSSQPHEPAKDHRSIPDTANAPGSAPPVPSPSPLLATRLSIEREVATSTKSDARGRESGPTPQRPDPGRAPVATPTSGGNDWELETQPGAARREGASSQGAPGGKGAASPRPGASDRGASSPALSQAPGPASSSPPAASTARAATPPPPPQAAAPLPPPQAADDNPDAIVTKMIDLRAVMEAGYRAEAEAAARALAEVNEATAAASSSPPPMAAGAAPVRRGPTPLHAEPPPAPRPPAEAPEAARAAVPELYELEPPLSVRLEAERASAAAPALTPEAAMDASSEAAIRTHVIDLRDRGEAMNSLFLELGEVESGATISRAPIASSPDQLGFGEAHSVLSDLSRDINLETLVRSSRTQLDQDSTELGSEGDELEFLGASGSNPAESTVALPSRHPPPMGALAGDGAVSADLAHGSSIEPDMPHANYRDAGVRQGLATPGSGGASPRPRLSAFDLSSLEDDSSEATDGPDIATLSRGGDSFPGGQQEPLELVSLTGGTDPYAGGSHELEPVPDASDLLEHTSAAPSLPAPRLVGFGAVEETASVPSQFSGRDLTLGQDFAGMDCEVTIEPSATRFQSSDQTAFSQLDSREEPGRGQSAPAASGASPGAAETRPFAPFSLHAASELTAADPSPWGRPASTLPSPAADSGGWGSSGDMATRLIQALPAQDGPTGPYVEPASSAFAPVLPNVKTVTPAPASPNAKTVTPSPAASPITAKTVTPSPAPASPNAKTVTPSPAASPITAKTPSPFQSPQRSDPSTARNPRAGVAAQATASPESTLPPPEPDLPRRRPEQRTELQVQPLAQPTPDLFQSPSTQVFTPAPQVPTEMNQQFNVEDDVIAKQRRVLIYAGVIGFVLLLVLLVALLRH